MPAFAKNGIVRVTDGYGQEFMLKDGKCALGCVMNLHAYDNEFLLLECVRCEGIYTVTIKAYNFFKYNGYILN